MNLYIRALGFDKLTSEAEEKFIKLEIEDNVANGFVIRHEKLNRGVIIVRISSSTGLYMEDTRKIHLYMNIIFHLLLEKLQATMKR